MGELASTVWLPVHLVHMPSGLLVGWNLSSVNVCVATVVPSSVPLARVEAAADAVGKDPALADVHAYSGSAPVVLGQWINRRGGAPVARAAAEVLRAKKQAELWITLEAGVEAGDSRVRLRDVYVCGFRHAPPSQVLLYRAPAPGQPYTAQPLTLDVGKAKTQAALEWEVQSSLSAGGATNVDTDASTNLSVNHMNPMHNQQTRKHSPLAPMAAQRKRNLLQNNSTMSSSSSSNSNSNNNAAKNRSSRLGGSTAGGNGSGGLNTVRELHVALRQINASACIAVACDGALLVQDRQQRQKQKQKQKREQEKEMEMEMEMESDSNSNNSKSSKSSKSSNNHNDRNDAAVPMVGSSRVGHVPIPVASHPPLLPRQFRPIALALHHIAVRVQNQIGWLLPRNVSTTAQTIEAKLQQQASWVGIHDEIANAGLHEHVYARALFLQLVSMIIFFVGDCLCGVALSCVLMQLENVPEMLPTMLSTTPFARREMDRQVHWLLGWPGGMKLNNNLDNFLGNLALMTIAAWDHVLRQLGRVHMLAIVRWMLIIVGPLGLSISLALLADLLKFATCHVTVLHRAVRAMYTTQLSIVSSLWQLFRGRKRNVLRRRIDSCDYDIDQLLLGTVLFAVFVFLVPTVMVYQIYFAYLMILACAIQNLLILALCLFNYFPMFTLLVKIAQPKLLTGGIALRHLPLSQCPCTLLSESPPLLSRLATTVVGPLLRLIGMDASFVNPDRFYALLVRKHRAMADTDPRSILVCPKGMHHGHPDATRGRVPSFVSAAAAADAADPSLSPTANNTTKPKTKTKTTRGTEADADAEADAEVEDAETLGTGAPSTLSPSASSEDVAANLGYVVLTAQGVGTGELFLPYQRLLSALAAFINPLRLVGSLIQGSPVTPWHLDDVSPPAGTTAVYHAPFPAADAPAHPPRTPADEHDDDDDDHDRGHEDVLLMDAGLKTMAPRRRSGAKAVSFQDTLHNEKEKEQEQGQERERAHKKSQ